MSFLDLWDGSEHREYPDVPHEALAAGPVWFLSDVSGRWYVRGTHARIEHRSLLGVPRYPGRIGPDRVEGDALVLYDGDREVSVERAECITSYDSVTVLEPHRRSLWAGIPPGTHIVFAWLRINDFD